MLESLSVKNVALIDSLTVEFEKGLNVLSGETGAGKSILIGALSFLLGGKTGTDIIRNGTEEALVSGEFFLPAASGTSSVGDSLAFKWLSERGIEPDGGRVLLRRNLKQNGRSSAWIQNTPVTRAELAEFTSFLVDIHGQHDHQSLFKVAEHRRFLDGFAGITDEVKDFTDLYVSLAEKKQELSDITDSEKDADEKRELLTFAVEEITKAKLKAGEDEVLKAEEKKLTQFEKLFELVNETSENLNGEQGIIPLLRKSVRCFSEAENMDKSLSECLRRMENCFYELEDTAGEIVSYLSGLTFSPGQLEEIQERLSLIYKLEKKYGGSVENVLQYCKDAERRIENFSKSTEDKEALTALIKELQTKIIKAGRAISERRKTEAANLQKKVVEILSHLGMGKTEFKTEVSARTSADGRQSANAYGFDEVEFMISPNPGEPLKPLTKIASGGELSRVMLALKTVLSAGDEADTLIFDEIDTGIGGEVALSVASHMKELSKKKQILCITHLAVIASHADNQIKIEKSVDGNTTRTTAFAVKGTKRVEEIARMLAGDGFSGASLSHAEELLGKYSG